MKTKKQWDESGQDLTTFFKVGDQVDEEMYDYFLCVLPPRTMRNSMIQIGEEYSSNNKGPTYMTLEKIDGVWTYTAPVEVSVW